jgi:hypothetical protein
MMHQKQDKSLFDDLGILLFRFVSSLETDLTVRAKTTEVAITDFSSASYTTIFTEEVSLFSFYVTMHSQFPKKVVVGLETKTCTMLTKPLHLFDSFVSSINEFY